MLRDPTSSRSQRLLITVLGDHQQGGEVATSTLITVMREFDISSDAVRTSLSRLVRQGVLTRRKSGRETFHALTAEGLALMREGGDRILSFGEPRPWDGRWTIVAFSIEESQRNRRHALRAQLRALGFAPLYDGMWLAAFSPPETASTAIDAAGVENAVIFRGEIEPLAGGTGAVLAAWELEPLRQQYEQFIIRFEPFLTRLLADEVSPAEALIASTKLMDDWRVFPRIDPELPEELLPADWPRSRARDIFVRCFELSRPMAELRYRSLAREGLEK